MKGIRSGAIAASVRKPSQHLWALARLTVVNSSSVLGRANRNPGLAPGLYHDVNSLVREFAAAGEVAPRVLRDLAQELKPLAERAAARKALEALFASS